MASYDKGDMFNFKEMHIYYLRCRKQKAEVAFLHFLVFGACSTGLAIALTFLNIPTVGWTLVGLITTVCVMLFYALS